MQSPQRARSYPNNRSLYNNDDGATSDDSTYASTHSQKSLEEVLGCANSERNDVTNATVANKFAIEGNAEVSNDADGAQEQSPHQLITSKEPSSNQSKKKVVKELPERQRSAMESFLSSPTNLAWADLVRSMREEMYIQTITIQRNASDDSSSLGSLSGSGSIKSMDSSISSKSLKRAKRNGRSNRYKNKGRGLKGRGRISGRKDSLERKVEMVLTAGSCIRNDRSSDDLHPFLKPNTLKGKIGGRSSAFSSTMKLSSTSLYPSGGEPMIEKPIPIVGSTIVTQNQQHSTASTANLSPSDSPTTPLICTPNSFVASPISMHLPTTIETDSSAVGVAADDGFNQSLLLHTSLSGESDDEDSFYYQIRGKKGKNVELLHTEPVETDAKSTAAVNETLDVGTVKRNRSGCASTKAKSRAHNKNPYAFTNHPLLPSVLEENQPDCFGHIPPFPTCWSDDEDGENEIDVGKNVDKDKASCVIESDECLNKTTATMKTVPQCQACTEETYLVESPPTMSPVSILPESLYINRKDPTCWQRLWHKCRKTKAQF